MAVDAKSLAGKEIADDYERAAVTEEGRWASTWNVFKKSFGKLVLINILMLITFAPAIAVLVMRNVTINGSGLLYPFNANTGLGYPANINAAGLTENLFFYVDLIFTAMLVGCGLIASIGVAGGAYSIKKLVNTDGKFTFKGFFHGIKIGYFKSLLPVMFFLVFYFYCVVVGDWKDLVIATGGSGAGPITAYVFMIIATVLFGLYLAWLLSTGISYRTKYSKTLKNSLLFLVSNPVQTLFIAGVALMPVWIYLIGTAVPFIMFIAYALFALIGFSYILLVWMSFTQWAYDKCIAPAVNTQETKARKNVGKQAEEPKDEKDIARELLTAGRSELIGKPILPIAEKTAVSPVGATFTRADIGKVNSDREKLKGEISDYENKHKNEPVYAEYNKMFAEREKALQPETDKKGRKKKKISANNLLSR